MLKILLGLALLTSTPKVKHYVLLGDHVEQLDIQSCEASQRLMQDKHSLVIYKNKAIINYTEWQIDFNDSHHIDFYHGSIGSYTHLEMHISVDDQTGSIELFGRTSKRKPCADKIALKLQR